LDFPSLYPYAYDTPHGFTDPSGRLLPQLVGIILLVILAGILFLIICYRFWGCFKKRVRTLPFGPGHAALVNTLHGELLACATKLGKKALIANLEKMILAGDQEGPDELRPGGDDMDPTEGNATTIGCRTYFAPMFYNNKTRCGQLLTMLHEAARVGGDHYETTDPQYNLRQEEEARQFYELACCLKCCHDLPPEVAGKTTRNDPTGCCPR